MTQTQTIRFHDLVEEQTRFVLGNDFDTYAYPNPSQLHDPFLYHDMDNLIDELHNLKLRQEQNDKHLLVLCPDYDADGIMSAVILSSALSLFQIHHKLFIPTHANGYGLSSQGIDVMLEDFQSEDHIIDTILTSDNGITAFEGVDYANSLGIQVLITDHHLGAEQDPSAKAIVNPNKLSDTYPFKGNSGACVAWKVMLAYARKYAPHTQDYIEQLIVFAGISTVADVMPLLDENRYIVKQALDIMQTRKFKKANVKEYDVIFCGLYELLTKLEQDKQKSLPTNEDLIGWNLSPLLNAPRRVNDTPLEAMLSFLTIKENVRDLAITALIELNKEKSKLRNRILDNLELQSTDEPTILCANAKSGIVGLVAGHITSKTNLPSVVFALHNAESDTIIYDNIPQSDDIISASGRSTKMYPLNVIMGKIKEIDPDIILTGGGHKEACGLSILAKNFERFKELFIVCAKATYEEIQNSIDEDAPIEKENYIVFNFLKDGNLEAVIQQEHDTHRFHIDKENFANDVQLAIKFQEGLRPFGKDYQGDTKLYFWFNSVIYNYNFNPDFWKTFKFSYCGVEFLTFDEKFADKCKEALANGKPIQAQGELSLNTFRGKTTPQIRLSACSL